LNAARAHVGGDADVAMLVKAVLDQRRPDLDPSCSNAETDLRGDATQALMQLGYSRPIASAAVEAASAHVGATTELATLIREALRRCGNS
jgi:Holliday junction resolvasome RuvABC DNA-binding subunit